jgi:hypothetical protein
MTIKFKFQHGDSVKDIITGFKGYVIGAHSYLTGCIQYTISPKVKTEGTLPDICDFDETRLIIDETAKKISAKTEKSVEEKGGPAPQR